MKFYYIIPRLKAVLPAFCFLFLIALQGSAQSGATSSPYSRFALGRPENTGFAHITAMGGSFTAMRNDTTDRSTFFINQGNPASYAYVKYTAYEFGARYGYFTFSGKDGDVKKQNGGFNYISLAFPIRKRIGMALGHVPFSNVGYEVTTTTENVDSIGNIRNNYRGDGGINQVYAGLGYRPFESRYKKFVRSKEFKRLDSLGKESVIRRKKFLANMMSTFSMGTNVSFLYGNVNYATRKYFPPAIFSVFNTCDYTETQLRDVYFQGGAQLSFDINTKKRKLTDVEKALPDSAKSALPLYRDLKKKWQVTLGYSASLPRAVSATASHLAYSFSLASFGREIPFDTFAYTPSFKGTVNLPFMQNIGIGIKRPGLAILLDAGYQQWSKFEFLGNNQNLKDQIRLSAGIQWQPSSQAIGAGAYFKRTYYRIGGRYNTGYLFLKGNQISEYAVSAGLGLPVGRYKLATVVNLSAEYGMAGTTNNQLVKETFLRFVIGLTFNDRWFIKPKYD